MLLDEVDPRLQPVLRAEWERRRHERVEGLPCDVTVVLVGHRAAGKTTLLPKVAKALGRSGVDLDAELVRRHQRPLKEWVETDERDFRSAERATFRDLPSGLVVAVGGGFLSHHAELLHGCVVVEVPISFETYVERLLNDQTRGRLRPDLPLEVELREIYAEREYRHAAAQPLSLVDFMLRLVRGRRPRRVVTLPPRVVLEVSGHGDPAAQVAAFAWKARHLGADLLEVRSDLHAPELELLAASRALPLLLARRTPKLPDAWLRHGSLIDEPQDGEPAPSMVRSFHADRPLTTREALARWADVAPGSRVKHVEPLGEPSTFPRLLETQAALLERFGFESVTVLATGPLALPFRAVLAQRNALDYVALDGAWAAAQGQRLLADATREARRSVADGRTRRLGILGSSISHSRSPRLHQQPFDRIDLPAEAPLGELLAALHPHYRGFAVTAPFKKRVAVEVLTELSAANTLIRSHETWVAENSDVAGADEVLAVLCPTSPGAVTVLGDGGVTEAVRLSAARRGLALAVLTRATVPPVALRGAVVWTWPPEVEVPEQLAFDGARVAVVSYGAGGRKIAAEIARRGGVAVRLGPRWFIAQARRQRTLWESAT